ncbi:MAG: aminotransferase class I/II-fold pyridoxal phosphate-dependent enzyme [Thiohalocapsa sp.]
MLEPAVRARAVAPFQVMRILERAQALEAAGRDIIHLEVGEPRFPMPELLLEAARHALTSAPMGYTPSPGLPALRQAIADHYGRRYGLDLDPARVMVTPGGSGALQLALALVLEVGDGVMVTEPGYPCHRHMAAVTGGTVHTLELTSADGWCPSASALAAQWRPGIRALMVTTPGNPTGTVIEPESMAGLYGAVRERASALIVDETYQGLVYGAMDATALSCGEDGVFVVNSFSKYFGLTGWRVGWLVVPPGWSAVAERLAQNLYLAAPTLGQHLALAALAPDALALFEQRRDELRQRRDFLLEALPHAGFPLPCVPEGAFYIFTALPTAATDAVLFAEAVLDGAGVAVTPGSDFGGGACAGMLRFAYAEPMPRLQTAVSRLQVFLAEPA